MLILSGDEDIKIGVQIAQTYGVRVHLLGIKSARGSQSDNLMMEADTCHEWDETIVGQWMHFIDLATDFPYRPSALGQGNARLLADNRSSSTSGSHLISDEVAEITKIEVANAVGALAATDLERYVHSLKDNPGRIHSDIDRGTRASLRNRLGRDLTDTERKHFPARP